MPPFLYNLALRRHLAARYFYKFQSATKDAAVSPWPVSCSKPKDIASHRRAQNRNAKQIYAFPLTICPPGQ